MKYLAVICVFVVASNAAMAQVPGPIEFSDQFAYTTGVALSGQGSWTVNGSGTSTILVVSGNQVFSGYSQSIGDQVQLSAATGSKASRHALPSTLSADIVYAYFLVNFSAKPTGTEMFFALRNAGGTAQDGMSLPGSRPLKVSARPGTILTESVEIGVRKRGGTRVFADQKPLLTGSTYLIVVAYSFNPGAGNDEVRLWVNPSSFPGVPGEPLPDASTTNGNDAAQITGVTLRESAAGGALNFDDLTIKNVDPSLPVELTSLVARTDGSSAIISWETSSENGNAGFDVEREVNGMFSSVAFVPGAGTTSQTQSYAFRVDGLKPGVHRFRLRQVDIEGTSKYSEIVESVVEVPGSFVLDQPYPNPFANSADVEFAVAEEGRVSLRLYDVLGREVQVVHEGVAGADQVLQARIDGTTLAPGIYLLRLDGRNFTATRLVSRQ
jgi:hypothetical protein